MSPFSFKDIVQADVKNIFFNNNEFSDLHKFIIDGSVLEISAQIDTIELIERQKGKYSDEIYKGQFIVYVNSNEFGNRPKIGAEIKMDNRKYIVEDVVEETGIYSITLKSNRG